MDPAHRGIWHATATPQRHPTLGDDLRADVAVVGAGITGLTTALFLADRGLDVVVLEALTVAAGVTGRTTAKVTSQHSLLYSQIFSKHGSDATQAYATANQQAVEQVAALVDRGGIDCQLERRPAATYTRDPSLLADVEAEAALCADLGLPASFTRDADLPFDILGAVQFDDQLQFQPVAYCDGLARMATDTGVRIFEQTRVTRAEQGPPHRVITEQGTVTAGTVVLATHVPILDRGMFFAKLEPTASHGIAVEIDEPGPRGMWISAESPSRSVRSFFSDGHQYLIIVGDGHHLGEGDETEHQQALADFAAEHWPRGRVTHGWMAEDFSPVDHLPYIGALARSAAGMFVATGYQKWGLSNATAAADILTALIIDGDHPLADAFAAKRLTVKASARSFLRHNTKTLRHLLGDRLGQADKTALDALGPGEGIVLRLNGESLAVTKDDNGQIAIVSAVCTHMGCLVGFNAAERSWDCPCHGSRFDTEGRVIHGPATDDL